MRQFYDVFLDRVAQGRQMTPEAVDAVGQGRVWTGRKRAARTSSTSLGGLREALDEARRSTGLPEDAPITELPVPESSLFDLALKLAGVAEVTRARSRSCPASCSMSREPWPLHDLRRRRVARSPRDGAVRSP